MKAHRMNNQAKMPLAQHYQVTEHLIDLRVIIT